MLECVEGFLSLAWCWYVSMFLLIIPLDSECRIQFPFPIDCDFVSLLDYSDEMICMLISNILYYKVINSEGGGYGYGFVVPESWGGFKRLISVLPRVIFQFVVCNSPIFWNVISVLCVLLMNNAANLF